MTQVYTKKRDDRTNKRYGRHVTAHVPVPIEPIHGRVVVPDDFKPIAGRLLAHALEVVKWAGLDDFVHVTTDHHYPDTWMVKFFFKAPRPKEIIADTSARIFVESLVPRFEEIASEYQDEIKRFNELAKVDERTDEIARWMVKSGRERAMQAIDYQARLDALNAELETQVQKSVDEFVHEVDGVVTYEDGTEEPRAIVDQAAERSVELAKVDWHPTRILPRR